MAVYELHDKAVMKRPHPCGENLWEITFLGADVKLRCCKCGRMVMLPRQDFDKSLKKVIKKETEQLQ